LIPWTGLTLLLATLSMDITAVGQFMVSRPIVVGPLIGALLGNPGIGLATGALVELIWIGDLPVGAHRPIDNTLLAGVGTFAAVQAAARGIEPGAAVTFALCLSVPFAALSSHAENRVRHLNGSLVRKAQAQIEAGHSEAFERTELVILGLLFLKAVLVAAFSLAVVYHAIGIFRFFPAEVVQAFSYAPWLLMVTGCAAAIDLLVEPRRLLLLGASAFLTAAMIYLFQTPSIYLLAGALFFGLVATLGPLSRSGGAS